MNAAAKKRPVLASGCTCRDNADHCDWCQATEAAIEAGEAVQPVRTPPLVPPEAPPPALPPLVERWLTAEEVAVLLAVGVRTVWRLVEEGRCPQPVRFTRKLVRFSGAKLLAWMQEQADDAQRAG